MSNADDQMPDNQNVDDPRSAKFYFETGDVMLTARWDSLTAENGEEQEAWRYFRVSSALLKHHSPIFETLFTLPIPTGMDREEYDGVPLVRLFDEGRAVEELLTFIYEPQELRMPWFTAENALRAKRVLDIGAKYQVTGVRPFIIPQLEAEWPSELLPWLLHQTELETAAESISTLFVTDEHLTDWLEKRAPDPACAIRIALEHNVPSVLPAAFYRLCQVDFEADYDRWAAATHSTGVQRTGWRFGCRTPAHGDGLPDAYNYHEKSFWQPPEMLARWAEVDRDTLYRLGMGKRALLHLNMTLTSVYEQAETSIPGTDIGPGNEGPKCMSGAVCEAEHVRLEEEHQLVIDPSSYGINDGFHKPDPLGRLYAWSRESHQRLCGKMCAVCSLRLKSRIKTRMEQIWDGLPHIFHLDSLELVTP